MLVLRAIFSADQPGGGGVFRGGGGGITTPGGRGVLGAITKGGAFPMFL